MAARKRKGRKSPARRRSSKGASGVSDVAKFVAATNRMACSSPKRRERTERVISYMRKVADLESSHGLTKTLARKKISGLLSVDKSLIKGMKTCAQKAARKSRSRKAR